MKTAHAPRRQALSGHRGLLPLEGSLVSAPFSQHHVSLAATHFRDMWAAAAPENSRLMSHLQ
jgi:hypothetical protein